MKTFLATTMLLLATSAMAAPADDPVVAERGADRLTLSQARALAASLDPAARQKLATPQGREAFLRDVLLQRAVLGEALAQRWDRRPEVAAAVQRARDVAVGESFLAAKAAVPQAYPPEADIQAAYDQNKPRFMQPRAYHLTQVFLPATGQAVAAARGKLADLRARSTGPRLRDTLEDAGKLVPGAQFVDLGWLPEPQITPAIKTTVSGLEEGALSDPVCTANGCHLIRLVATRPAGPAPLAEVRDALIRALRQQKQAEGERAYADSLLAKQPVKLNQAVLSHLASP